jgi:hypothetical protein
VEGNPLPETGDTLVALGITLFSYGLAELAHGYGFLAVFVTALTMRQQERSHHYRARLHEFSEQLERLFMMVLLVLFGGAIALPLAPRRSGDHGSSVWLRSWCQSRRCSSDRSSRSSSVPSSSRRPPSRG